MADKAGRPTIYVNDPRLRKEYLAHQIAQRDGIREGLVCVLTAVEVCNSFDIQRNREKKWLELVSQRRRCMHLYHYFQHPVLGLTHMRFQTWFPFNMWCNINGRAWLARELDRHGIGFLKRENCLVAVSDVARAQALADQQVHTDFAKLLAPIAAAVHLLQADLFAKLPLYYYWSCQDSEWASDIMFKNPATLAASYPHLLGHGIEHFGSWEIMRFMGRKVPVVGGRFGTFAGEVVSDLKERPEGMRIKHCVNGNSIKMYDKQGRVLRIETMILQPQDFKVYRVTEAKPKDKQRRKLRKGVADMPRRAKVSQAANQRYADALASAKCDKPLKELAEPICRPVKYGGRRVRGLNPWESRDAAILEVVNPGEFTINGLRNRDLQGHLYAGKASDPQEQRRRSARITRQLRQLRAHKLIKKVPRTHRYILASAGRDIITSLLAARAATAEKLMKAA